MYIKDSIKHLRRDGLSVKDLEQICPEIKPPNSTSYLLAIWYSPSSCPAGCVKKLEVHLGYFGKESREVIILTGTDPLMLRIN